MIYWCGECNSPRKNTICQKCGAETFVPSEDWEAPKLPPIEKIRQLAMECGYAIGEHGTQERDLDLIAAPWAENAHGPFVLATYIAFGLNADILEHEIKPLGRIAFSIQMKGWYKMIDLSVCPMVTEN